MTRTGPPAKQGLYDPRFEHEACGVGFVVNIKGRKSHAIIQQALQVLLNLNHRGACGCEANTGDGAGILIQPRGEQAHDAEDADRHDHQRQRDLDEAEGGSGP